MLPVAIAAGAAAAFAISYEGVKEAVTGIAISVALLPPLVAIGIGFGGTNWELMKRSLGIFSLSFLGILITTFTIFLLLGFYRYSSVAKTASKKEEKVLQS